MKFDKLLKEKAQREQMLPEKLRQYYVMERFLYRLSVSEYASKFILKGGMLMLGIGAAPARYTADIDLLGYVKNEPDSVAAIIRAIIGTRTGVQDGVSFKPPVKVTQIMKDALYVGVRASFSASVRGYTFPMKVDVGFGDVVYPMPEEICYPATLEGLPAARLRCYPKEAIVAEKWQAMIRLGTANSRMKDIYDLWFLSRHFSFHSTPLRNAIMSTCAQRGTDPLLYRNLDTDAYRDAQRAEWAAYIAKLKASTFRRKPTIPLPSRQIEEPLGDILAWLAPIMENDAEALWTPQTGWK